MKRLSFAVCCVLCALLTACRVPAQTAGSVATVTTSPATTTTTSPVTTTATAVTTTTTALPTAVRIQGLGLYEADTLNALYTENADERLYPASLVKITTAYTALRYVSADSEFTVGSELSLIHTGSSVCRIQRGQRLTLRDLIAGMMISSGNDAAYTVAVNVARAVEQDASMTDKAAVSYFCGLMNETARELGAVNTHYVNPDGWDDPDQYTTVRDLALLIHHAMQLPEIAQAAACVSKTVSVGNGTLTFNSTNRFLYSDSEFYDERVNGFKTGSTSKAGKCLAVTAAVNGKRYIAVVTNCKTDTDRYQTMQKTLARIPEWDR